MLRTRIFTIISALLLALGLSACGDTAGPEAGADVGELQADIQAFEEDIGALEDRVGALEEEISAAEAADVEAEPGDDAEADVGEEPIEDPLVDVQSYVGEQVTVSSEVQSVLSTHAFTLSGPQGPLLVTSASGMGDNEVIEQDAVVQVGGTVREQFSVTEFENEFGVELDDELYADFEEQTYIVADSVTEAPPEDNQ